jgi:hypothetical protein
MTRSWHHLVVRVPLKDDAVAGVRTLRRIERWLAGNHRPVPLFHPDGRPRSDTVCVAVPSDEAHRALTYRAFCAELGLASSMVQWRVGTTGGRGREPAHAFQPFRETRQEEGERERRPNCP